MYNVSFYVLYTYKSNKISVRSKFYQDIRLESLFGTPMMLDLIHRGG